MPSITRISDFNVTVRESKRAHFLTMCVRIAVVMAVAVFGLNQGNAAAQLTLTPAASAAGWKLTVFASGFTPDSYGIGPLGIAFTDAGGVIVADWKLGDVRVFPTDTDNQNAANIPIGHSYGYGNGDDLLRIGNNFYMTEQIANQLVQINPDGTLKQQILYASGHKLLGLAVNPKNGHLFVAQGNINRIADVDPVAKTGKAFLTLPTGFSGADGLSTDGTTLYAAANGHILGFRISDQKLVFDSGFLLGADGCAVGFGYLFVNTNDGQVFQIDLATQVITLLATGGGRGDFVKVAPNGTLLVTQSSWIARLTPPPGESFETANISIQPSTVVGGTGTTGTITLSIPAPANLVVSLTSDNTVIKVPTTKTVTVPAGANTVTFPITTSTVTAVTTGEITATLNGVSNSAKLTVKPK